MLVGCLTPMFAQQVDLQLLHQGRLQWRRGLSLGGDPSMVSWLAMGSLQPGLHLLLGIQLRVGQNPLYRGEQPKGLLKDYTMTANSL